MQRRNLAAGLGVLALAACNANSNGTTTSVEQVIAEIQAVLPFVQVLSAGMMIAVPAIAPALAVVTPYLNNAAAVFATISATMSVTEAKPIVAKVTDSINGALDAIGAVVQGSQSGDKLAQFNAMLAQARAVVSLLSAFATGVQGTVAPKATMSAAPSMLYIRTVH